MEKIVETSIQQKIFSSRQTTNLYIDLVNNNGEIKYQNDVDSFDCDLLHPKGGSIIFVSKNFKLLIPDNNNKYDLENTKTIYSELSEINPTQASDKRLWTYLTHITFWEYMRKRWPLEIAEIKKKTNFIKERYFLENLSHRALTHNGISRLWWFGHLTYDMNRKNPWELTEVLLKNQDLPTALFERELGANKNIRIGVLEFFKENPEYLTTKFIQEMVKLLNLAGGVSNLPYFTSEEIKALMNKLKFKI